MRAPATFPDEPEPEPRPSFALTSLTSTTATISGAWATVTWVTTYAPTRTILTWRRA